MKKLNIKSCFLYGLIFTFIITAYSYFVHIPMKSVLGDRLHLSTTALFFGLGFFALWFVFGLFLGRECLKGKYINSILTGLIAISASASLAKMNFTHVDTRSLDPDIGGRSVDIWYYATHDIFNRLAEMSFHPTIIIIIIVIIILSALLGIAAVLLVWAIIRLILKIIRILFCKK